MLKFPHDDVNIFDLSRDSQILFSMCHILVMYKISLKFDNWWQTYMHFLWLFLYFSSSQNNDIIFYNLIGFWKIFNSWPKITIIYISNPSHPKNIPS